MLPQKVHRYIFLFGIISLGFGLMMGRVPTSVPLIILMANWVLEGRFVEKWRQLKGNRVFWALALVFFIHLLALTYTSGLDWALNDLKIKMPLLSMPMILLSTRPLGKKEFDAVLYAFIVGSLISTAWSLLYAFVLHPNGNLRDASRFMSHIRLGLYLNLAIGCCAYLAWQAVRPVAKITLAALGLYFVFVLFALGLASGLANFILLLGIVLLVLVFRQKPVVKLGALVLISVLGFIMLRYVVQVKNQQLLVTDTGYNTPYRTSTSGRPLIHFDTLGQKENGNYVLINLQLEDLRKSWNRRVPQDSFSYEPRHNLGRYEILVRYLASRGLAKDAEGVAQLSAQDLENICQGVANYLYPGWGFLHKRLYELVNEYDDFRNNREVNGHSLAMRLYFSQAALEVARQHPVIGVGTGGLQPAMNEVYKQEFPKLKEEWYKRPHNQYLSLFASLGLVGLFIFLLSLIYPAVALRRFLSPLYWLFLIILCLSFVTEDTLETQAGLSFYAVFNSLFLSSAWFKCKGFSG